MRRSTKSQEKIDWCHNILKKFKIETLKATECPLSSIVSQPSRRNKVCRLTKNVRGRKLAAVHISTLKVLTLYDYIIMHSWKSVPSEICEQARFIKARKEIYWNRWVGFVQDLLEQREEKINKQQWCIPKLQMYNAG